jgi:hypothetical protein
MKKIILIFAIATTLFSCGKSPVENAIINYLQIIDENNKIDLSIKILKIEHDGEFTLADSLEIILNENFIENSDLSIIKEEIETLISEIDGWNNYIQELLEDMKKEASLPLSSRNTSLISFYSSKISEYSETVKELEEELLFLEQIYSKANYFNENRADKIADKYKCTYSFKNPFLNVQQELTETFLIATDNVILGTLE